MPIVRSVERCQSPSLHSELSRSSQRTAGLGPSGGIFECRCDVRIRPFGAERKVPSAFLRVGHGVSESPMHRAPLPWKGHRIDAGHDQRVREMDPIVLQLDNICFEGGEQLLCRLLDAGTADQLDGRLRQGRAR